MNTRKYYWDIPGRFATEKEVARRRGYNSQSQEKYNLALHSCLDEDYEELAEYINQAWKITVF